MINDARIFELVNTSLFLFVTKLSIQYVITK